MDSWWPIQINTSSGLIHSNYLKDSHSFYGTFSMQHSASIVNTRMPHLYWPTLLSCLKVLFHCIVAQHMPIQAKKKEGWCQQGIDHLKKFKPNLGSTLRKIRYGMGTTRTRREYGMDTDFAHKKWKVRYDATRYIVHFEVSMQHWNPKTKRSHHLDGIWFQEIIYCSYLSTWCAPATFYISTLPYTMSL